MKILVTGGAGFIGSHIVDELVRRHHEVTVFDNLDPQVHPGGKKPPYLNKDATFIQGDVRDYAALKRAVAEAEIIFHEASAVGVAQSQYEIKRYVDVNTGGTAHLCDILVNHNHHVEKLIVASSMSIYGEGLCKCPTHGTVRPGLRPVAQLHKQDWEVRCPHCAAATNPIPTGEEVAPRCNSIYAITKRDQEDIALIMGATYGIPVVSLRYFNVYGPRQSLSNPYTGVAAIFLSRVKSGNRPVVYEDGLQSRDFVSVHDVVTANMLAMEREEANGHAFNIGTGQPVTIREIAELLARTYGADITPEITGTFRKGDIRHCIADITKARSILGYRPTVAFAQGINELIEWSRDAVSEDKFERAAEELERKGLL